MTVQHRTPVAASVSGMSTSDSYVVPFELVGRHLRGEIGGEAVVDSRNAVALFETRYSPVYYFPKEDVSMNLLTPTEHRTHCPFKGDATYWTLSIGGRVLENIAWSYESPYPDASEIAGYIAFYVNKFDAWWEDGELVAPDHVGVAPMP
ncbi:MAG: DUF427 domain-containing protein [Alphaproteobacteria bacterium]|nr:DUF427 domain-containing protein [Alphaproteobacteria bacterium]